MPQPDPQAVVAAALLLALGMWTILVVWIFFRRRRQIARRMVPLERRRPVPWGGLEVVLLFAVFVTSPIVVAHAASRMLNLDFPGAEAAASDQPPDGQAEQQRDTTHAVGRLLRQDRSITVLVISAVMVVLAAPIVEEFLFRVVLQGWFEKIENRFRRRLRSLRAFPGTAAVLMASALFAAMHFQPSESDQPANFILFELICQAVASLIVIPLAIVILRVGCGATWADMGLAPGHLCRDAALGLLACVVFTGPIYLLFITARLVLPEGIAADPIALLPLAVVLGTLYYRTHRVAAPIVLHMAFNAAGLAMALLTISSP